MKLDLKAMLVDLKARQDSGEHMPCPRCGKDTMKPELHTNALSRHADVYVCDSCGTCEALLDFMNNPLPLERWACFEVRRPESDFEALGIAEAMAQLQKNQIPWLCKLYRRWLDKPVDFEVFRREAYENCRGLKELWHEPFRAVFETSTHLIHVRFSLMSGRVVYAENWVRK